MTQVTVYEVGPRDGLQNEKRIIPTAQKIALVDALSATGLRKIEVTSFVSPKWVPQLADAAEVMAGISRRPGVDYAVLTPNRIGMEKAVAAGASEVAIFASASEGFSQKNINCSIAESLKRFAPIMPLAAEAGIPVRGYISCVVECPYDGAVAPSEVARVAQALSELGCYEVSLGDTLGRAVPATLAPMLDAVLQVLPPERLAGHFHDTGGTALQNVACAMERGLATFDSAVGGLGGCPYAPGAQGNLATGALVDFLQAQGVGTGLDRDALARAEALLAEAGTLAR